MRVSIQIDLMNLLSEFLTIHPGIVGLHVGALDFAIFNYQCITLATVLAEDGSALEGEVEVFVELTGWITQESDLCFERRNQWEVDNKSEGRMCVHQSWRWGQGLHPRLSCYTIYQCL